jgi:hypothetical protein
VRQSVPSAKPSRCLSRLRGEKQVKTLCLVNAVSVHSIVIILRPLLGGWYYRASGWRPRFSINFDEDLGKALHRLDLLVRCGLRRGSCCSTIRPI